MAENLNESNFLVYAMKYYDNPQCFYLHEVEEDLKRFLYLKKLLFKYQKENILRDRLILNHIIILYNVFGDITTDMLFYKIDKSCWNLLITFLVYLERMPDFIPNYNIRLSDVELDEKIIFALRNI